MSRTSVHGHMWWKWLAKSRRLSRNSAFAAGPSGYLTCDPFLLSYLRGSVVHHGRPPLPSYFQNVYLTAFGRTYAVDERVLFVLRALNPIRNSPLDNQAVQVKWRLDLLDGAGKRYSGMRRYETGERREFIYSSVHTNHCDLTH